MEVPCTAAVATGNSAINASPGMVALLPLSGELGCSVIERGAWDLCPTPHAAVGGDLRLWITDQAY